MSSRILHPTAPGGLYSPSEGNELTPDEELVVQAIAGGTYFRDVTPTGDVDGENATFVLPSAPNPADSLVFSKNGVEQIQDTDYTLTDDTVVFVSPPEAGTILIARYRRDPN